MQKKSIFALAVLLFLATALFGCGKKEADQGNASPASNSPAEKKQATVLLGLLKLTGGAPLYIAMEKGFFKEENLDVQHKWFDSSNAVNVALASNSIDVAANGLTADLYNMVAAGQKMSIVADKGKEEKGYQLSAVVIHKDSPITKIEDLKGKKVGVTSIGSAGHYMIGNILEKHGMSLKDIELISMNSTRAQMESLKGKNVDAVMLLSSNIAITLKEGYGKVLANVADEMSYQSTAILTSPKFTADKDVAERFMRAYIKGTRYYHDAVLTKKDGQLVKGQNYDEVVKIVAKYTEQPEEIIKESFPYMDRDAKLTADDIKTQIDWYLKEKLITKSLDSKEIVDTELYNAALKTLEK
ncbi:ABC transporter substrate-binding protein [Paenibacillus validus]|uniref:ABC transporter substrate-binding protein n=1 Tax=Paenibacillus validus TaxID=44253 RepID=UPI000FD76F84|nr:ABC transporter substrate-binding protein [Paenibacillus validus]MED4599439.1 ABC transporter substrate-binding protein [Paenibacillus validus]MED4605151.1 ABC transporter substrate-binding protein [Paenibacillus validus]